MTEIVRISGSATQIVDIVVDVKRQGCVLGVDFDFKYHSPKFDDLGSLIEVAYTEFLFYNNSLASWFVLKYS